MSTIVKSYDNPDKIIGRLADIRNSVRRAGGKSTVTLDPAAHIIDLAWGQDAGRDDHILFTLDLVDTFDRIIIEQSVVDDYDAQIVVP